MRFRIEVGSCVRSAHGFTACGDAVCSVVEPTWAFFAVVDALGHGPDAQISAHRVTAVLERAAGRDLAEVFALCDEALKGLRGAVMSAARVDARGVSFAGIGNVDLLGPLGAPLPASTPGIVGRGIRRLRQHPLAVEPGQRWLLISDGVRRRDARTTSDAARHKDAQSAAEHVIEHASRLDDDASVLVIDFNEAHP